VKRFPPFSWPRLQFQSNDSECNEPAAVPALTSSPDLNPWLVTSRPSRSGARTISPRHVATGGFSGSPLPEAVNGPGDIRRRVSATRGMGNSPSPWCSPTSGHPRRCGYHQLASAPLKTETPGQGTMIDRQQTLRRTRHDAWIRVLVSSHACDRSPGSSALAFRLRPAST